MLALPVIDMRLALAHTAAQALLAGAPGAADLAEFHRSLGGLSSELRRLLRWFEALDGERVDTAAHGDELARLYTSAARLMVLLLRLQRRAGASGAGLAPAVQQLATEVGRPIDMQALLRALNQATALPTHPPGGADTAPGLFVDALFVVVAAVSVLSRGRVAHGD